MIFLTQGSNQHLLHLLKWEADSLPPELLEKPQSRQCGFGHPSAQVWLPAVHRVVVMPEGPPAPGSCSQGLQAQGMPDRDLELLFWVGWSQPRSGSRASPWQTVPAWGQRCQQRGQKAGQGVLAVATPGLVQDGQGGLPGG